MSTTSEPPRTGFDVKRLIEEYQAGVWRYLRALGCEATLADDLTQETFLAVLEKPFEQYNPTATGAYLRRVAYNLFITHRRREGKVVAVENLEQLDAVWNELVNDESGEELLTALRSCLAKLTERARWALEMRFRERRSRAEIATALEITENGAKNLMQRAKQQLRSCIEGTLK